MNIIDRRLNPKSKSLGNRQRFIRRAKNEFSGTTDGIAMFALTLLLCGGALGGALRAGIETARRRLANVDRAV